VTFVTATDHQAFAAIHEDGSITSWGDSNVVAGAPSGFSPRAIKIVASSIGFAALFVDGSATDWGIRRQP
jgi:hypothetical protein